MILCHKSECRKPAVLICDNRGVKYCDIHWSELVTDTMIHYDCSTKDHHAIDPLELSLEDQINRLFSEKEQDYVKYLKVVNDLFDIENKGLHKGRTYYITTTPEEKEIKAYNERANSTEVSK